MVILLAFAGLSIQTIIGYIILKFAFQVIRSVISQVIVPIISGFIAGVWLVVKGVACVLVGGVVILVAVSLISNL